MIRLIPRRIPQLQPSISPQSWKTGGSFNGAGLVPNFCSPSRTGAALNKLEPSAAPLNNTSAAAKLGISNQLGVDYYSSPQSWKKPDGRGKSPGSRKTQFKRGIEWTGNRGGRLPRPFRDAVRKYVTEINPKTGRTHAEDIALNIINIACSAGSNCVRAAKEVHKILGLYR
jgi:hypothetical protein